MTARERPSKNFGNVLKLDEIAANPHFIVPGNPLGSKLFKQIVDKEMPYDVEYEGETKYPKIAPDELKALETWIVSLAATKSAACESHKFVSNEDLLGRVVGNLWPKGLRRAAQENWLYLGAEYPTRLRCLDDKNRPAKKWRSQGERRCNKERSAFDRYLASRDIRGDGI